MAVAPVSTAQPSLTDPGVAPTPGSAWEGNALAPARRSLDARRTETMDRSAWTPAAFVQEVRRAQGVLPTSSCEAQEINIEIMADPWISLKLLTNVQGHMDHRIHRSEIFSAQGCTLFRAFGLCDR